MDNPLNYTIDIKLYRNLLATNYHLVATLRYYSRNEDGVYTRQKKSFVSSPIPEDSITINGGVHEIPASMHNQIAEMVSKLLIVETKAPAFPPPT